MILGGRSSHTLQKRSEPLPRFPPIIRWESHKSNKQTTLSQAVAWSGAVGLSLSGGCAARGGALPDSPRRPRNILVVSPICSSLDLRPLSLPSPSFFFFFWKEQSQVLCLLLLSSFLLRAPFLFHFRLVNPNVNKRESRRRKDETKKKEASFSCKRHLQERIVQKKSRGEKEQEKEKRSLRAQGSKLKETSTRGERGRPSRGGEPSQERGSRSAQAGRRSPRQGAEAHLPCWPRAGRESRG